MIAGRPTRSASGAVAAVFLSVFPLAWLAGCQEPLPVPRIEPTLEGWAQPYAGLDGLRVHAFRTGAVLSLEGAAYAGGSWTTVTEMGAWAFVLEHPTAGLVVFDTGLSARGRTDPEHFVGWLGAQLDMLDVPEGATLAEQMSRAGLNPAAVRHVVLSHAHFDHTGGIADFPNATVVVGAAEKAWLDGGVGDWDFVDAEATASRATWTAIDFTVARPVATLLGAHDLLGDGSVIVVDLSGHTPGSVGIIARTGSAPVLLTGDAAWTDKSWRWPAMPVSAWDRNLWWEQAWRIKRFATLEPLLVVVPGHDDAAVAAVGVSTFVVHEVPGGAPGA